MDVIKYLLITLLLGAIGTGNCSLKDPTIRPKKDINHDLKPKDIVLEMVYISNGHKTAIINGQGYNEGDYIGASKIQHIEFNSIIVNSKNKTYHFHIDKESPQINLIIEDSSDTKKTSSTLRHKRSPRKRTWNRLIYLS